MKSKLRSHSHTTAFAVFLTTLGLLSFLLSPAKAGNPDNTAVGVGALKDTTGNNNIGVGSGAGGTIKTGSDNIDIGNSGGGPAESKTIRIGTVGTSKAGTQNATYIAGIYGVTLQKRLSVVIDSTGHLGTETTTPPGSDENLLGLAGPPGNMGNTAAEGVQALASITTNTTGKNNTATGWKALNNNTKGVDNMADGFQALEKNIEGSQNTATGSQALNNNIKGGDNTASGFQALEKNIEGSQNTATGLQALNNNIAGSFNTANGWGALFSNIGNKTNKTGSNNTATGWQALHNNTQGNDNTANGVSALTFNTAGNGNVAVGKDALGQSGSDGSVVNHNNVAVGLRALENSLGSNNIALGYEAGRVSDKGDNNIFIGNEGSSGGGSDIIHIGRNSGAGEHKATFIAGITSTTTGLNGILAVMIDPNGRLCAPGSSKRFKKDIKPMNANSDVIMALKPVTFHYKNDSTETPQFGLVAEDVERVNPDLVVRDADGKVHGVRYDAVNAMLLNEFLKEHKQVQDQQKQIDKLSAQLKEQAEQIQKVNQRLDQTPLLPLQVGNSK